MIKISVKKIVYLLITNILWILSLTAQYKVVKVNFLDSLRFEYNASAPTLVKFDKDRAILGIANANTPTFTVIETKNEDVKNIPIKGRAYQHLKEESFTLNRKNGSFYLIGMKKLHVILPQDQISYTILTEKQFEMVAVDEEFSTAFLIGRESKDLAIVDIDKQSIEYVNCFSEEENLVNLNQTPPPPIRKVVFDNLLRKIIVIDGYTSQLLIIDPGTKKIVTNRKLELINGARWHYAGYNEETHHLYLVVETDKRKVVQCGKIDVLNGNDVTVELPEFSEGVGIKYNPALDEVYIPYDNHPSVHVVEFTNGGKYEEIKIPFYGNDASVIDEKENKLFVASWAYGEIEIVDLISRKFVGRIPNLGIIPHMFSMDIDEKNNNLFIPKGATAVNGVFGSSITIVNYDDFKVKKLYTGWTPMDIIRNKFSDEYIVVNNEDQVAYVKPDGSFSLQKLPFDYPNQMTVNADGNVYISYGPHQSYWPTVYIWGAKNGVMMLNPDTKIVFDRRIPRLSHKMLLGEENELFLLQNSWGKEKQFILHLEDDVREFTPGSRIELEDEIERETIQRLLEYDSVNDLLFLVKVGESDTSRGLLQVVDINEKKIVHRIPTGITPTDLVFNDQYIYISNFDSNSLTRVDRKDYSKKEARTKRHPVSIALVDTGIYVLSHSDNLIEKIGDMKREYPLPLNGKPDNMKLIDRRLYITSHSENLFSVFYFDVDTKEIDLVFTEEYPYGDTNFNNDNSAFYLRGQWGDSVFNLSKIITDEKGRIVITDYLSGKMFIIKQEK